MVSYGENKITALYERLEIISFCISLGYTYIVAIYRKILWS